VPQKHKDKAPQRARQLQCMFVGRTKLALY